jgi:uncharacterized protein
MKIWLDTSSQSMLQENDCAVPSTMPVRVAKPFLCDASVWPYSSSLLQTASLYIQSCGNEHWLVCDPTGTGRIAVFDAQAMELFALFEMPTTISQAACRACWPQEDITKMVMLLQHLGFLQDITHPIMPPEERAPEALTAWLHVTNGCNLRCSYCYLQKTKEDMSAAIGHKAIDAIFRSALKHRYQTIRLKYAGGEASLRMLSLIELHDYAIRLAQKHSITLEATILSNGVALTQRAIDLLRERHIAVTVSLDGLGDTHDNQRPLISGKGSGRFVMRAIDRLLANEVVPSITITVSQLNLAGLADIMRYILERDLPFSLNYYRENEFSRQREDLRFSEEQMISAMRTLFTQIEEKLPPRSLLNSLLDKVAISSKHHHACGVGKNYLVVDQHGGVAKCQMEITNTVATVDVDDLLHMVQQDHSGVRGLRVEEKEGCRTCEWRNWCAGGCPITTYRATGRYDVKSPNCRIYKALFPDVLRLEALRLLRYEDPFMLNFA